MRSRYFAEDESEHDALRKRLFSVHLVGSEPSATGSDDPRAPVTGPLPGSSSQKTEGAILRQSLTLDPSHPVQTHRGHGNVGVVGLLRLHRSGERVVSVVVLGLRLLT